MDLLSEEVGFVRQQDLRAFYLSEIEYQCGNLLSRGACGVGEAMEEVSETNCLINDVVQGLFLIRLERQACDFGLPV